MATKKPAGKSHGWQVHCVWLFGRCIPVGFIVPSNAGVNVGPLGIGGGRKGSPVGYNGPNPVSGIGAGLKAGADAIFGGAWKNAKDHAWEWIIGASMLLVLIGSARRLTQGGD